MTVTNTLYLCCTFMTTVIVMISLLSTTKDGILKFDKINSTTEAIDTFFNLIYKPYLLLIIAIQYFIDKSEYLSVVPLLMLWIPLVGLVLNSKYGVESCKCFGDFSNEHEFVTSAVKLVFISCTAYLLAYSLIVELPISTYKSYQDINFIACLAIATSSIAASKIYHKVKVRQTTLNNASSSLSIPTRAVFKIEDVLGLKRNGGNLLIKDVCASGKPILVVGVTGDCRACAQLKKVLPLLDQSFGSKIQTVVLHDSEITNEESTYSYINVNNSTDFMLSIGVDKFPFAFILNPIDAKMHSPVVYGANPVWNLYYLILSLLPQGERAVSEKT